MRKIPVFLAALAFASAAMAQSSANFEIKAQAFNAGGQPPAVTSADFQVALGAIGDGATAFSLGSASFGMDGGFSASFPPPGEVAPACSGLTPEDCLLFTSKTVLTWPPERSTGAYNLYRDTLTSITPGFGACEQFDLPGETATDLDVPAVGTGFFYLVTAENCLEEEGTKGFQSNLTERANLAPCP